MRKKINKMANLENLPSLTEDDFKKQIDEINRKAELALFARVKQLELDMEFQNRASNKNRARSISVGTASGGTTEVMLRGDGGRHMFMILQPVEVIELIHQLSANVGCHLALKPREDFSSWRDWRVSEAEKKHLNGWAPFANDMAVFQKLGSSGFDQQKAKQIMDILADQKDYDYVNGAATLKQNEEIKDEKNVATKKIVNRRKSKQSPTSS